MSNIKGAAIKPSQALCLDVNQQKNFIKFWLSLGEKLTTTVRVFDRNDYYSLHGEDAHLAAKIIFKSSAGVKTMSPAGGSDTVPDLDYLCLGKGNFETLIRDLLLVKSYRVEVYTKRPKSEWALEFKGSPGNLTQFEQALFSNHEMVTGTSILSLNLKIEGQQRRLGAVSIDVCERNIHMVEFTDDDFFSELEALIVVFGPRECILPGIEGEFSRIKTILERNGIMISTAKKTDYTVPIPDIVQDLNKLLSFTKGQSEDANTLPEVSKLLAMSALGAAIKYLKLLNDVSNSGYFKIESFNTNRFVHLDNAAVTALNLLPKPGQSVHAASYKWQSILGVLDRCLTAQGHRLIAQWVKQPLKDIVLIRERHDIVECFIDASECRQKLRDQFLKKIPDIMVLIRKLMRKNASLRDIYKLYYVVNRGSKILCELIELENKIVENVLVEPMKESITDLRLFKQMVQQVIDPDGIEKGEFFIKPSFDDELNELKTSMSDLERNMGKDLKKVASDLELERGTSIKLEYVSHLGYHFRISVKDDRVLRKNNKYKTLDIVKGGVRFTSEKLSDLNADFKQARLSYEQHQKSIVNEVVRVTVGYLTPLTCLNNQIAQLDCFLSLATVATAAPKPYVRPEMYAEGSGILNLKQVRHPCMELREDVIYIPNDVKFEKGKTHMYVITGPNMGGKSTYIRSVGCAAIMAHIGSFVPCDAAQISILESVLGRIGADDNINKGLSTFMVEMIETTGIIRNATPNSLVIIDELGRGTSTYEGCGVAWGIAEHLARETKSFSLFATHFHEIAGLSKIESTVKSCHMAATINDQNFTLLYKIQDGVMDKSFGIQIAKLANFPDSVVKFAERVFDDSENFYTHSDLLNDKEALNVFNKSIEQLKLIDLTSSTDDDIQNQIEQIQNNAKCANSKYFQTTFPSLFTTQQ